MTRTNHITDAANVESMKIIWKLASDRQLIASKVGPQLAVDFSDERPVRVIGEPGDGTGQMNHR